MDLPISLIGTSIEENKIYYFTSKAPIGIPEHMHVCIRIKGQMLLFSTCTSQTDTVYRLAVLKKWDMNTFPCFKKNAENQFTRDLTFVNCNNIIRCSQDDFADYLKQGVIIPFEGVMNEEAMRLIANGVRKSKVVAQEIKDLFE